MPIKRADWRPHLLVKQISSVLAELGAIATVLMMVAISLEVILRYGFNRPTSWAIEISTFLMMVPIFWGAGYTLLVGGHVRMESVVERLPKRAQLIIMIITYILSLTYLVPLTWSIFGLFVQAYQANWHSDGLLGLPLFPAYLAMGIGSFMFCLAVLVKIVNDIISLWAK